MDLHEDLKIERSFVMKTRNKLTVQDFMTTGLYTSIYFVLLFAIAMLGYIPIFIVLLPLLIGIIGGIPFILFLAKTNKFGMVTLSSLICGTLMTFAGGHSIYPILTGFIFGVIADLIYHYMKSPSLSYATFSLWTIGILLPIYIQRDSYFAALSLEYGDDYATILNSYLPNWTFVFFVVFTFLSSLAGAMVGKRALNKHFRKSGVV